MNCIAREGTLRYPFSTRPSKGVNAQARLFVFELPTSTTAAAAAGLQRVQLDQLGG